jgi:hypothetical protein
MGRNDQTDFFNREKKKNPGGASLLIIKEGVLGESKATSDIWIACSSAVRNRQT